MTSRCGRYLGELMGMKYSCDRVFMSNPHLNAQVAFSLIWIRECLRQVDESPKSYVVASP